MNMNELLFEINSSEVLNKLVGNFAAVQFYREALKDFYGKRNYMEVYYDLFGMRKNDELGFEIMLNKIVNVPINGEIKIPMFNDLVILSVEEAKSLYKHMIFDEGLSKEQRELLKLDEVKRAIFADKLGIEMPSNISQSISFMLDPIPVNMVSSAAIYWACMSSNSESEAFISEYRKELEKLLSRDFFISDKEAEKRQKNVSELILHRHYYQKLKKVNFDSVPAVSNAGEMRLALLNFKGYLERKYVEKGEKLLESVSAESAWKGVFIPEHIRAQGRDIINEFILQSLQDKAVEIEEIKACIKDLSILED